MLKRLELDNFTLFPKARLDFAPGLNVIVGENGTGKSHLLKAAYSVIANAFEQANEPSVADPTKVLLQKGIADKLIKLTSHEFRLLSYMMHHRDRVISRTEMVEHIYDQDFDRDSNTIEVFVGRLRKKIGSERIETVRGLGYRLVDPQSGNESVKAG